MAMRGIGSSRLAGDGEVDGWLAAGSLALSSADLAEIASAVEGLRAGPV